MEQYSFKELYDVRLKSTYNMEINGRKYESNEVIILFDNIQIAGLNEVLKVTSARGGYDNRSLITWTNTKEVNFTFSQGVFSSEQLSFLTNARLLEKTESSPISVDKREIIEANENGIIILEKEPNSSPFFYLKETNDKLLLEKGETSQTYTGAEPYKEVIVDYAFDYYNKAEIFQIGKQPFAGYVSLEGKTKIKDDTTGFIKTGIIKIPKLKIVSNLSVILGENANSPVIATFNGIGYPDGPRGNSKVAELQILSEDLDNKNLL